MHSSEILTNFAKNVRPLMRARLRTCILLLLYGTLLSAQSLRSDRFEERAFSLAGGATNLLDTYLSPLSYKGGHVALLDERFAPTTATSERWFTQSLFSLHGDYTLAAQGRGLMVGGMADYSHTYYYEAPLLSPQRGKFRLFVGPQGQLRIGGIYNLRNSNNPAQLKLGVNLAASAMAKYAFTLWETPMNVRLQTDLPLLGVAFGPDYGQSYYEIFYLGQSEGCVHLTSLHNNLSLRTKLSYDVEFRTCTLRLTWQEDLYHWQLGNQQYRMFTHSVMIGYVRDLYRVMRDEEARQVIPY